MAFNGSGLFQRLFSWVTDASNGIKVSSSRMDAEMDGMATGLSNAICKDGQQTASARIPFVLGVSIGDGAVGAPGVNFVSDTDSGFYRIASNDLGIAIGGALTCRWGAGGGMSNAFGTLSCSDTVATTVKACNGNSALYIAWANLEGSGLANYAAWAVIFYDASLGAALRLDGVDGAKMAITVSGANIKATQSSGSTNTVTWCVFKIGN